MDIPEKLKQYKAQLEKANKATTDLENLGQDNSEVLEIIRELEQKVKTYKERAQNDLPESLIKVRERYRKCRLKN